MVLFFVLSLLASWSCSATQFRQYAIDKPSPNGSLRVRVMVKKGEQGKTLDQAKFQFLIGEEVVDSWDWKQEDHYDENFDSYLPIQWVAEDVLRIGGRGSQDIRFSDNLKITNVSGEYLQYVDINYGKTQLFKIFKMDPGEQVDLQATPQFTAKGGDFSFGYTGVTKTGRRFGGIMKLGERVYPDGPRKLSITISPDQIE